MQNFAYFMFIIIFIFIGIFLINYIYDLTFNYTEKIIYFGQTIDLENNMIANKYVEGFDLAFQSVNRKGGINGYKLKIILYNDNNDEKLALANADLLINYFNVLGIIGTFSTSITLGIINYGIIKDDVPVIAPFGGSMELVKNFKKNLFLVQGTQKEEFKLIINHMVSNKIKKISIIYQNDISGKDYLDNFITYYISNDYNIEILSIADFERNSTFLYDTFGKLFNVLNPFNKEEYKNNKIYDQIQAVLLFVSEQQTPKIYEYLKKIKPDIFIYNIFFAGNLKTNFKYLNNNTDNIYQTLLNANVKEYPDLYDKLIEEIDYYNNNNPKKKILSECNSLYQGFYSGLLIIEVLKKIPDLSNISRKEFIDMFYKIQNFNIYGLKIGPYIDNVNNIGLNQSYLTKIENNNYVIINSNN